MMASQKLTAKKRSLKTKLALIAASVTSVAVLGSAGVAAAAPAQQTMNLPSKEACKTQWSALHFKNRGDCVSYWNKHKPHHNNGNGNQHNPGHGYGGQNNGGVTVIVNGDHNVINIVINYFFGG